MALKSNIFSIVQFALSNAIMVINVITKKHKENTANNVNLPEIFICRNEYQLNYLFWKSCLLITWFNCCKMLLALPENACPRPNFFPSSRGILFCHQMLRWPDAKEYIDIMFTYNVTVSIICLWAHIVWS